MQQWIGPISEAAMEKIAFGNWNQRFAHLSDDEFLASIKWRKQARTNLQNGSRLPLAFKKKLASRQQQRLELLTSLTWSEGMIAGAEHGPLYQVVIDWARSLQAHQSSPKNRARGFMGKDDVHVEKIKHALEKELPIMGLQPQEIVAGLVLLLVLADELPAPLLLRLWRFCLSSGLALSTMLDEPMGDDVPADIEMLFQAEIPWILGLVFGDIKGSGELTRRVANTIEKSLEQGTDRDGTPHPGLLARLPFWLGSMNRMLIVSGLLDAKLLDSAQKSRLGQLLRHAISMSRADGQIVLSQVPPSTWLSILCQTADELGWDASQPSLVLLHDMARVNKSVTKSLTNGRASKRHHALSPTKGTLPSTQTDWGKMAHLRTAWSQQADLFSISYDAAVPRIEFSPRGKLAFRGDWHTQLTVDGASIPLEGDWSCSCWFADEEVDYLELQLNVEGPVSVQLNRMVFLSRDQQILLLGDALHLEHAAQIEYTSTWPAVTKLKATTEQTTRSVHLQADPTSMRVLPLFIPREKIEKAHGSLDVSPQALSWSARRHTTALFIPLLLDWNASRRNKDSAWKDLTVAEDGKRLPDHAAAAKLASLGKKHYLIYHALSPGRFGRSVMGHHTHHETVIGEFDKQGALRPLVHIETPEED